MNEPRSVGLQGYCPVAYFVLSEPTRGSAAFSLAYEGKLYYFTSEEAKQVFNKNPEKFLPAYGGLCAFGMSIEKEFEPDPTNFKIINGKVHLFLKNDDQDALRLWNKEDEAKCLLNANRHWEARSAVTH